METKIKPLKRERERFDNEINYLLFFLNFESIQIVAWKIKDANLWFFLIKLNSEYINWNYNEA